MKGFVRTLEAIVGSVLLLTTLFFLSQGFDPGGNTVMDRVSEDLADEISVHLTEGVSPENLGNSVKFQSSNLENDFRYREVIDTESVEMKDGATETFAGLEGSYRVNAWVYGGSGFSVSVSSSTDTANVFKNLDGNGFRSLNIQDPTGIDTSGTGRLVAELKKFNWSKDSKTGGDNVVVASRFTANETVEKVQVRVWD